MDRWITGLMERSAGILPNVTNFWAMDFSRLQIETGLVITDKLKI
jgi:hypothetical protein